MGPLAGGGGQQRLVARQRTGSRAAHTSTGEERSKPQCPQPLIKWHDQVKHNGTHTLFAKAFGDVFRPCVVKRMQRHTLGSQLRELAHPILREEGLVFWRCAGDVETPNVWHQQQTIHPVAHVSQHRHASAHSCTLTIVLGLNEQSIASVVDDGA